MSNFITFNNRSLCGLILNLFLILYFEYLFLDY